MTENQKNVLTAVRELKRIYGTLGGLQAGSVLNEIMHEKCRQNEALAGRVEAWLITAFSRGDLQPCGAIAPPPVDKPANTVQE